jgi:hypothetical protein
MDHLHTFKAIDISVMRSIRTEGSQYPLEVLAITTISAAPPPGLTITARPQAIASAMIRPKRFRLGTRVDHDIQRANRSSHVLGKAGESDLLRNTGDAFALAERIAELARDPALRAADRQSGREMVESSFSLPRFLSELIQVYEGSVVTGLKRYSYGALKH